ncbi:MAG: hypothetical protein MUC61_00915 [Amoebophilaceae bacterium]|nr:hypothetical protein [Amoebophilaceae bacterium]
MRGDWAYTQNGTDNSQYNNPAPATRETGTHRELRKAALYEEEVEEKVREYEERHTQGITIKVATSFWIIPHMMLKPGLLTWKDYFTKKEKSGKLRN